MLGAKKRGCWIIIRGATIFGGNTVFGSKSSLAYGLSISPQDHLTIYFLNRELIFTEPDIIATPSIDDQNQVSIIMQVFIPIDLLNNTKTFVYA